MSYEFIDDYVAISPMITNQNISNVVDTFDLIIVLDSDLVYDINRLGRSGVRVIFEPIDEGLAHTILKSYEIIRKIISYVMDGKKVLIQCKRGLSRSRALAAQYLIFKGYDLDETIRRITRVYDVRYFSKYQLSSVKVFHYVLKLLTHKGLNAIYVFGKRFNYGKGLLHASLTLEYSALIINALKNVIGLTRNEEIAILVSSALHDVGFKYDPKHHNIKSFELIRDSMEVTEVFGHLIRDLSAWIAYYHNFTDESFMNEINIDPYLKDNIIDCVAILQLANTLSNIINYRVASIDVFIDIDIIIKIVWNKIGDEVFKLDNVVNNRCRLLSNVLGVRSIKLIHDEI